MIITAIDHSPILDGEGLLRMAQREFGAEHVRYYPSADAGSPTEYRVEIDIPGEPSFAVDRYKRGQLSSDGTEDQDYRVAVAVRAELPDTFPRLVALRDDGSEYVDLVPGITPADIQLGWRDVSEGGF
jgi:hypothetical protein